MCFYNGLYLEKHMLKKHSADNEVPSEDQAKESDQEQVEEDESGGLRRRRRKAARRASRKMADAISILRYEHT